MKFTTSDIQTMADAGSYQRGVEYFKQRRVKQTRPLPSGNELLARVVGSGRKSYEVALFWDEGALLGNCTCPVATGCKHCVATALQWLHESAGTGLGSPALAKSELTLQRWLAQIPQSRPSGDVGLNGGQSYVIYQLELRNGRLDLLLQKGYLKKNGQWSQIRHYSPDYFSLHYSPPAHVQPEDVAILQLLPRNNVYNREELSGEAGRLALTHMLITRRLFFKGQTVRPLPSQTVSWRWEQTQKGYQLHADLADHPHWHLLPTEPPCFLDTETAGIGELIATVDAAQLAHLQSMPPVPDEQIQSVAVTLRQQFSQDRLPLPVAEPELITADQPTPCLSLTLIDIADHPRLPALFIHFEYADQRVEPHYDIEPFNPVELHQVGERTIQVCRNIDEEVNWIEQIHQLGFILALKAGSYQNAWTPDVQSLAEALQLWQHFIDQVLPVLARQGWCINTDASFSLPISDARFDFAIKDSGQHWFEFALALPIADKGSLDTTEVIDQWLEQGAPDELILALGDEWVRIDTRPLHTIRDLVTDLYNRKQLNKPIKLAAFQAAQLQELPELDERKAPLTRALLKQLQDFSGIAPVKPSKHLNAELRPYQQEGLNWLVFIHQYHLGGILADDMGLGKTLQTLALLQHLKDQGQLKHPAMIVAPTSLTGNWLHEAARFTPGLKTTLIHGPNRAEAFKAIAKSDVVITTYPLLPRDKKHYVKRRFSVVVLDEAQAIKNPTTQTAQQVRTLNAETRLCLTGTPLENHLGELWSLVDFVLPGLLAGRKSFQQQFRTPIEQHGDTDKQQRLARRVAPFMLRRTKSQVVKELPAKTEMLQYVELQGQQRALYESIRVSMQKRIRELVARQGIARSHIQFLDALLKLRQASIDPRLVKLDKASGIKEHAKLDWLNEHLPQLLEEGRNILVFSQFTQLLSLIEADLKAQKIPYSKLTGQTRKRQEAIDSFQGGKTRVFLISLKAGGSGLNLTAADVVIHMDPWWNPAVENQATDRAHRIGQKKPVFVYKLVAADTVEERIQQLQREKQSLADSLFDETRATGLPGDKDSLLSLLA
ncbi:DEAD/DEAH box helicase [uncultured Gilvimarinus sp.]|uniref:DEAD/DEAH box helicase n=1 Tax=uncultured Gilvimarinus sp. TaxID=1689143 RepID=UPI0030ECD5F9